MPTLGETVTEATVATWFKGPGDAVEADEMLCELETDKVSVEVPAPAAGTLSEILAAEGATVEAGGKLAVIAEGAAGPAAPASDKGASAPAEAAAASAAKDVLGTTRKFAIPFLEFLDQQKRTRRVGDAREVIG